ncbi:hypothetical protein MASR1M32_13320 [Rhodobacter sp.]
MRQTLPLLLALTAGPALADPLDDRALAVFAASFADLCGSAFGEDGSVIEAPQRHDLQMDWSGMEPQAAVLWQFRCNIGAYNVTDVFLLHTDLNGVVPLSLAQPALDVAMENPEDFESPLKSVAVAGWSANPSAVNASFDPATATLSATGYWRGVGDAYDAGTWVLRDGGFRLVHYEADASYDGEAKPQLVLDFP